MISHHQRGSRRDRQHFQIEAYKGSVRSDVLVRFGGKQTTHPPFPSSHTPSTVRCKLPGVDPNSDQLQPSHTLRIPFNALPPELISEIFVHFTSLSPFPSPSANTASGPLLLLHVCTHWRALASSLPKLWSTFSTGQRRLYPHPTFARQWLARAGPVHPLDLHLECTVFTDRLRGVELMELFVAHAPRWREIRLELDESLIERFACVPWGGAPGLETAHLTMKIGVDSATMYTPRVLEFLSSCGRLTRLSLALDDFVSPLAAIPWERLTCIHLECSMGLDMWITLLSRCSQVVNLSVKGLEPPTTHIPFPENAPALPHLRHIAIDSRYNASQLLLHFTLPVLESLSLAFHIPGTLEYDLNTLLRRSPFVKLALLSDILPEDTILACVSQDSLNSVCELSLTSRYVGEDAIRALTYSNKPGVEFLCGLEKLTLGRYTGTQASFVQMVASRCQPEKVGLSRLKVVEVLDGEGLHKESLGWLAERGLVVL